MRLASTRPGLTKVFKFEIFTIVGLAKILRNVFWTRQNKLLRVSLQHVSFHDVKSRNAFIQRKSKRLSVL